MSSELVRRQPTEQVVLPASRDTVDGWVAIAGDVGKLAAHIANTEFVPKNLRGKPAAVMAAILYGRELGLGPIQALQSVHVIDGRPAISAELARAMAFAHGHSIHIEESTTTRCVVRGRRAGADEWTTITWTMDDAKTAGLAGKDNWRKHPRRLLQARATGELCHLLFADAIGGMPFTVEEAMDDTDAAGLIGEGAAAPEPRTARRASAKVRTLHPPADAKDAPQESAQEKADEGAAPEDPPLPGDPGYEEAQAPESAGATEPLTKDQLTKLQTVFGKLGLSARPERLKAASTLVGQRVGSFTSLTKGQASALIDTLEKVADGPDPPARLEALLDAARAAEADGPGNESSAPERPLSGTGGPAEGAGHGPSAGEGSQRPLDGMPDAPAGRAEDPG